MIAGLAGHQPVLVYFDPDRITLPAEVCGTCSDEECGRWVPAPMCPKAAAQQDDGDAPSPHVVALDPKCRACGRRDQMTFSTDPRRWECGHSDCLHISQEDA